MTRELETFLRPLYQDLDGVSRFDDVERIGNIARRLTGPSRELDLLVLFHLLGTWLEKLGNLSRVKLAIADLTEEELRRTAASIRRLDAPESEAERAVAAAILIDGAGVRGFAEKLSRSRREGQSILDVARTEVAQPPAWMDERARNWLAARSAERRRVCQLLFAEMAGEDLT